MLRQVFLLHQQQSSVTDSLSLTKTALTDNNGKYTITDISSGAFSGSISKGGYTTYDFSGSLTPGQTIWVNGALSPVLPILSNIACQWYNDKLSHDHMDNRPGRRQLHRLWHNLSLWKLGQRPDTIDKPHGHANKPYPRISVPFQSDINEWLWLLFFLGGSYL